MHIQPYLNFNGRSDEAIEFYKQALGAKVTTLMRWKDMPAEECGPDMKKALAEKVMHATLKVGDSIVMLSDGRCDGEPKFAGITLSISASSYEHARQLVTALAAGGRVTMPLAKTFFSPGFAMLTDRFGVAWMIVTEH